MREQASGRTSGGRVSDFAVPRGLVSADLPPPPLDVVVGLRHRSPVGKMLMGSVAQRILLDADVPVLSVKPGQTVPL